MLILQPLEATLLVEAHRQQVISREASGPAEAQVFFSNISRYTSPTNADQVILAVWAMPSRQPLRRRADQLGLRQAGALNVQTDANKATHRSSWKAFWAFRFWEAKAASHVSHRRLWGGLPRIKPDFDGGTGSAVPMRGDGICL